MKNTLFIYLFANFHLLLAQRQRLVGCDGRGWGGFFALEAPGQLLHREIAQRRWKRGNGHLTQAALVVTGGKMH